MGIVEEKVDAGGLQYGSGWDGECTRARGCSCMFIFMSTIIIN